MPVLRVQTKVTVQKMKQKFSFFMKGKDGTKKENYDLSECVI
jgi:hypothetical protein